MTTATLALCILVAVIGVILVILGFAGKADSTGLPTRAALRARPTRKLTRTQQIQLLGGFAVGLVFALVTGWWLLIFAFPIAAVGLPWLMAKGPEEKTIAKLDALDSWTRSLSGLTVSGSGLERTIAASLASCPEPIRPEVTQLVARLNARWTTTAALQAFADDLNDETGDVVVMHLLRKAELRGSGLAAALEDLAKSIFERVKMRRQIEADRATPRNEARFVVYFTVALLLLLVLAQQYSAPYGTALGQMLLAIYLAAYALVLWWMRRISRGKPAPRLLVATEKAGER